MSLARRPHVLYHLFLLPTEVAKQKQVRVWRNWQTRTVQVRMGATP